MRYRFISTIFILMSALSAWAYSPGNCTNPTIPLLRLKLVLDSFNYDDIAIGFMASATTVYNNQIDSRYLPGVDASEGLSSLSSDNVPLSVNIVPLPANGELVIRLDVEARNGGPYILACTELDSIPSRYEIWLIDKYTRDSLNLRANARYALNINKTDTASFGANRFTVVIRQNAALTTHLLGFDVLNSGSGYELQWTAENEQNTTTFTPERSIDGGQTFVTLDSIRSRGLGTYRYIDKNPLAGVNMYRLKMTDGNGTVTLSDVVSVGDESQPVKKDNTISIYPNPSNGPINLTINQQTGGNTVANSHTSQVSALNPHAAAVNSSPTSFAIKILNINGVVVRSATTGSAAWRDNISSLSPGTYLVQVVNNSNNTVVGKSSFIKL